MALFSQIPTHVLKKHKPASVDITNKKVQFWDDEPKEVSSSREESSSDTGETERSDKTSENEEPIIDVIKPIKKETSDAILQTDPEPELKTVGTQTDFSFKKPLGDSHERFVAQLEASTLSDGYRPIYSMTMGLGKQPPLKIGMTLPKGKKRKVYYPDEENNGD